MSIVVALLVGVILFIWFNNIQPARNTAECKANLKSVGAALADFHETNDHFPAAYSGDPMLSWRVQILPTLGATTLYEQYDRTAAWDSPQNEPLLSQRPSAYRCPSLSDRQLTPFRAIVGVQTAWPLNNAITRRHFLDGTSNTIQLIEQNFAAVPWTSTNDVQWHDMISGPVAGPHSASDEGTTHVLTADGSVRTISQKVDVDVWRALLTPQGGRPIGGMNWTGVAAEELKKLVGLSGPFATTVPSSSLTATRMLPFADEPLVAAENMIYCPTFALAWKHYRNEVPQVKLTDSAKRLAMVRFDSDDINANDLTIIAGSEVGSEVAEFRQTSGFDTEDDLLPSNTDGRPVVYCALKKELPFIAEFEPFENPLVFHTDNCTVAVRSFGVTSDWDRWGKALGQIRVLAYRSPEDFIIRIGNLAGEDLILARMTRPKSMDEGMARIATAILESDVKGDARAVVSGEQLVVPVLEMSLLDDFTDSLNHPQQPAGQRIFSARQKIQFRLNEAGAKLISEAAIIGENGHYEYKVGERTFIFDKPFMIVLRESSDKEPYFAAWIANNDLMLPPR